MQIAIHGRNFGFKSAATHALRIHQIIHKIYLHCHHAHIIYIIYDVAKLSSATKSQSQYSSKSYI